MSDTSAKKNQERSLQPPPLPQKRSEGPAPNWAERRRAKRIDVTTELTFQSESNFYTGFTADISTGGVFVVTWDTVPIGHDIRLTFTLPDIGKEITVDGTVRWVREYNPNDPDMWPGMGIQFENVPPEVVATIEEFVSHREPLFYDE